MHERPRISHEAISVILPAFNQAPALAGIMDNWLRALKKPDRDFELIVIDDGSTDSTAEVAHGFAERDAHVKHVRHDQRRGSGASVRIGLASSRFPLVCTLACDYPYQPNDLKKLLDAIDSADIVSGCRTEPMPPALQRSGRIYRALVRVLFGLTLNPRPGWQGWSAWRRGLRDRWIFGLRLHDVSCALKLYRRTALDRVPIQSDGEFVYTEILAKANFMNCLIAEIPIGRLGGAFKGIPEPPIVGESRDFRRVFRAPSFGGEPRA